MGNVPLYLSISLFSLLKASLVHRQSRFLAIPWHLRYPLTISCRHFLSLSVSICLSLSLSVSLCLFLFTQNLIELSYHLHIDSDWTFIWKITHNLTIFAFFYKQCDQELVLSFWHFDSYLSLWQFKGCPIFCCWGKGGGGGGKILSQLSKNCKTFFKIAKVENFCQTCQYKKRVGRDVA